jgi:hypothetical protein
VVVDQVLKLVEQEELVVTVNLFLIPLQEDYLFPHKVIQSQLAQVAQVIVLPVVVQEHKVQVQFSLQSHLLVVD